jgi:CheY-like chemotaxis protein/CRP-like cAMP-binding protein
MKKILLIEDDTTLRETTAEILELENYEVVTASNGKKGVELAKQTLPNIIICDIMMPEMDGYQVLEILSNTKTTQRIPFIFMSAKTEIKEVRKGMDLGADDYLTKPVSEELLISAIESRLAKAALLNEKNDENKSNLNLLKEDFTNIKSIEELKNYFCDFGTTKIFEKGELIYREGQFCNDVYLIYKGNVKSFKTDELGKELILNIYSDDDFFGFSIASDNMPNYEAIMALEKTELVCISKVTLLKILENNHELYLQILKFINDNLTEVKEQLMEMAYGSIRRKTAKTIIKFANKMTYKPTDNINISRRDLASVAGVATESLIRTLTNFKKEGILDIEGRNIKILNLEKLKSIH